MIFVFVVILSLAVAVLYTKLVTSPILKIASTTRLMAEKGWENTKNPVKRKDEIGELAQNINSTFEKLKTVLQELDKANVLLQDKLNYQKKLNEERKEFFWAASHELKTPVTILKNLRSIFRSYLGRKGKY